MRNHKSLTPEDVIKHGPAKIALMVASEFLRASSGAEYRADVVSCYARARELMGLLETLSLGDDAGSYLKPYYQECIESNLLRDERLTPHFVKEFGERVAGAFEKASSMLSATAGHA